MAGNKGEWSEVYVLLKLLADGKLYAADGDLNKIADLFFPIIKILRKESQIEREYCINGNIKIVNGETGDLIRSFSVEDFVKYSKLLLDRLNNAEGRSFDIPEMMRFLSLIDCNTLKPTKSEKSDIEMIVHDLRTGSKPKLGFSIKSMLGQNSTLFNPGNTTNFIYRIESKSLKENDFKAANLIEEKPKIANRLEYLKRSGCSFVFTKIQSKTFEANLRLIDSSLPEIIAFLLLYSYTENCGKSLIELVGVLEKKNPLSFDLQDGHPFYKYKIKSFLTDSALGMVPAQVWEGKYEATGGIIIVKQDGEIVCYHIYNRNEFQDYLLKNTRLEQASTSRYSFGDIYEENGQYFIKLNLQVRFN